MLGDVIRILSARTATRSLRANRSCASTPRRCRYDGGAQPVSLGCGLFGLGAIFDLGGDDHYRCAAAGLGAGIFGVGLLVDYGGNDTYTLDTHDGEGSAVAGVGLLIDLEGNKLIKGQDDRPNYKGLFSVMQASIIW